MLLTMLFMLMPAGHADPGAEQGQQNEVVELREKNSQTFLLDDGSYECVVYAEDKYFEDDSGELVEIDNTVVPQKSVYGGKEYAYTNRANSTHIAFAENEPAVLVSSKARSLAFGLQTEGAAGVSLGGLKNIDAIAGYPLAGNNMFAYTGALQSTDIVYEVRSGAVKEYIVLYDASAPTEFTFTYDTEGYTAAYTERGAVGFYDAAGELCFELSNLFAVDSAEAYTEALTYTIGEAANGRTAVTVSLSEEYAHDPERAYPVLIDPSTMITGETNTKDSYVSSRYGTTNYYMNNYLKTGRDADYYTRRTFIKFDLPTNLYGANITSAYINIKMYTGSTPSINAYRVTGNWTSSTITWNNMPGISTVNASATATVGTGSWYVLYVTNIVRSWINSTYTNYGFMIKDATETGTSQWTAYYSSDAPSPNKPELRIRYFSINCWYADEDNIGWWAYSPQVWRSVLIQDSAFAFLEGIDAGISAWNNALGISSITTLYSSAPIKYYGGSLSQINAANLFDIALPSTTRGFTQSSVQSVQTCVYNNSNKNVFTMASATGCVIWRSDIEHDQYIKTCMHELGHAFGWFGHPNTNQPTWVMYGQSSTQTTLKSGEIQHLAQVY